MGIGICGASGTGKTTIATSVSKVAHVEYVGSVVREVYKKYGISPQDDIAFKERCYIQDTILAESERAYANAPSLFITDRTPIDFAAYLLADVQRTNLDKQMSDWVVNYVERCIRACNKHFRSLIVLQPGIAMVNDGERPTSVAYNDHMNFLMTGLVSDQRILSAKHVLSRDLVSLDKRVSTVLKIMDIVTHKESEKRGIATVH